MKCYSSRLAVVFAQYIEGKYKVQNEDVVGASPIGDAPTTSKCSAFYRSYWISPISPNPLLRVLLGLIYHLFTFNLYMHFMTMINMSGLSRLWLCVPRARLSIYRGYIWYDGARSTVVSTITIRSGLHSRTTPRASPFCTCYGVSFASYICKNDYDISREHDILFLFPSDNSCFQLMIFVCTCNRLKINIILSYRINNSSPN